MDPEPLPTVTVEGGSAAAVCRIDAVRNDESVRVDVSTLPTRKIPMRVAAAIKAILCFVTG